MLTRTQRQALARAFKLVEREAGKAAEFMAGRDGAREVPASAATLANARLLAVGLSKALATVVAAIDDAAAADAVLDRAARQTGGNVLPMRRR